MKKLRFILILVLALTIMAFGANNWVSQAKYDVDGDELQKLYAEFDGSSVMYSKTMSFGDYDGSDTAIAYSTEAVQTNDSTTYTVTIEGSYDKEEWESVDTIASSQSDTSLNTGTSSIFSQGYPYYRVKLEGTEAEIGVEHYLKVFLYLYAKE